MVAYAGASGRWRVECVQGAGAQPTSCLVGIVRSPRFVNAGGEIQSHLGWRRRTRPTMHVYLRPR